RDPAVEALLARDVPDILELARVDRDVAVRGLEQPLEVIERERLVHRERAHDRQPNALVDHAVERDRHRRVPVNGLQGDALLALVTRIALIRPARTRRTAVVRTLSHRASGRSESRIPPAGRRTRAPS